MVGGTAVAITAAQIVSVMTYLVMAFLSVVVVMLFVVCIIFALVKVTLPRTATRDAQMGAARQRKNGSHPTYDSGALLANWTMQILSADTYATLP